MSRSRRIIAALAAAVALGPVGGLAITATGALAKTCQTPAGSYDVTAPPMSGPGADPAEVAAADCTLGFHEKTAYPLSVISVCLLATLGTVVLLRRRTSYDAIGSEFGRTRTRRSSRRSSRRGTPCSMADSR